ncbi:hypothetical protein [Yersinia intermedia]|uniref:hypothetical protein n=1 Tax=Yersinia intermedia TaxID=631 RepID=UPI0030CC335E
MPKRIIEHIVFSPACETPEYVLGDNDFVILNKCEGYTALVSGSWDENNKFLCFKQALCGEHRYFENDYYVLWARLPQSFSLLEKLELYI